MAARRCTLCGINYPMVDQFKVCPIHNEETDFRKDASPDANWKDQFAAAQSRAKKDSELSDRVIPLVHGVEVIADCGQLFVDQNALMHAGLRLSRMMNVQFYLFELDDGWIYETQGFDEPRRRWWVEKVAEAELPDKVEELSAA